MYSILAKQVMRIKNLELEIKMGRLGFYCDVT